MAQGHPINRHVMRHVSPCVEDICAAQVAGCRVARPHRLLCPAAARAPCPANPSSANRARPNTSTPITSDLSRYWWHDPPAPQRVPGGDWGGGTRLRPQRVRSQRGGQGKHSLEPSGGDVVASLQREAQQVPQRCTTSPPCGSAALPCTAAPHRTAPHSTAPHRKAPHNTSADHGRRQRHRLSAAKCMPATAQLKALEQSSRERTSCSVVQASRAKRSSEDVLPGTSDQCCTLRQ